MNARSRKNLLVIICCHQILMFVKIVSSINTHIYINACACSPLIKYAKKHFSLHTLSRYSLKQIQMSVWDCVCVCVCAPIFAFISLYFHFMHLFLSRVVSYTVSVFALLFLFLCSLVLCFLYSISFIYSSISLSLSHCTNGYFGLTHNCTKLRFHAIFSPNITSPKCKGNYMKN